MASLTCSPFTTGNKRSFNFNCFYNSGYVKILLKNSFCSLVVVKVQISKILVMQSAKFTHYQGFPHLPSTLQNKRLPISGILPFLQIFHKIANHVYKYTKFLGKRCKFCTFFPNHHFFAWPTKTISPRAVVRAGQPSPLKAQVSITFCLCFANSFFAFEISKSLLLRATINFFSSSLG